MPGLLARQQLGEHVRLAVARAAAVALTSVARSPVGAVELHPRASMLRPEAFHRRCAHPRHAPRVAPHPDGLAQRDATGGSALDTEKPAVCRHILEESAAPALLAMQKVVGSNPISRSRKGLHLQVFF